MQNSLTAWCGTQHFWTNSDNATNSFLWANVYSRKVIKHIRVYGDQLFVLLEIWLLAPKNRSVRSEWYAVLFLTDAYFHKTKLIDKNERQCTWIIGLSGFTRLFNCNVASAIYLQTSRCMVPLELNTVGVFYDHTPFNRFLWSAKIQLELHFANYTVEFTVVRIAANDGHPSFHQNTVG